MKQRPHLGTVQRLASGLDLPPGELSALFAARNLAPTPRRAADQAITVQPAPVAPLVGREQELSALTALLRDPTVWLVTLTGVGGVGKTRLALEVAHELESAFQHGAVVVPLGDVSDHRLVAQRLANVLGIKLQNERTISNSLQQREQLLVLDGFEHLLSAAPLVTAILARCPRLKILITSRVRLGIRSERVYPLQPFEAAAPHGEDLTAVTRIAPVELFRQRAVAANPEFILDEETTPIVATICSQLDGLPLAIELAAARSRVLSPQAILARLRRPLHLLTGGPSDAPGRQRTLRSSIAWSYGLLDPQAQLHFDRVSVFTGGFTLEAAASLCQRSHGADPDLATLEAVTTLVDHSLLRRVDQSNGEPRFSTLATHREFGLERLEASGETDTYRRAHATYFIDLVAQAEPELDGPHQAVWLQRLTTDLPNIRAALTWLLPHDPDRALPVLAALDHALGLPTHANETSFLLGTPIDADVNRRDRSWAPLPAGPAAMEITPGNRPKANRLITNRPELVIATRDEPCS